MAQEEVLQDAVAQSGLERYEISNYSKPGFECRHNVVYWRCDDWLGFGASAHSHIQGQRWWNRFAPDDYMRGVAGGDPVDGRETLGIDQRVGETLAVGLRMVGGVPRQLVIERFGQDAWAAKGPGLAQLVADGLVAGTRDAVRLTRRGLAFADTAAALLI
jgi:oxygen-independent coproporphyrinogen-3 oxidase